MPWFLWLFPMASTCTVLAGANESWKEDANSCTKTYVMYTRRTLFRLVLCFSPCLHVILRIHHTRYVAPTHATWSINRRETVFAPLGAWLSATCVGQLRRSVAVQRRECLDGRCLGARAHVLDSSHFPLAGTVHKYRCWRHVVVTQTAIARQEAKPFLKSKKERRHTKHSCQKCLNQRNWIVRVASWFYILELLHKSALK